MMIKKILTSLSLLVMVACAKDHIMEIEGRLSVKGSSTHTYLNIKDIHSNKNYKILNKTNFDLMQKQNQTIKMKVKLIKKAIGPGFPALVEVVELK